MVEQIQRKFEQDKRKKAVAAKAFLLEARKRRSAGLVDQEMAEIVRRNHSPDMLSMVEGATFFAAS